MSRPQLRYRLAGYDASGNEILDWDVLDAEELAEDHGWIPRRREQSSTTDPALVEQVAALQATADPDDVLAGLERLAAEKRGAA